jgi:hypothetical protein
LRAQLADASKATLKVQGQLADAKTMISELKALSSDINLLKVQMTTQDQEHSHSISVL